MANTVCALMWFKVLCCVEMFDGTKEYADNLYNITNKFSAPPEHAILHY